MLDGKGKHEWAGVRAPNVRTEAPCRTQAVTVIIILNTDVLMGKLCNFSIKNDTAVVFGRYHLSDKEAECFT